MRSLLDWLSPPSCAACDRSLRPGQTIFCEPCAVSLEPLHLPRCPTSDAQGSGDWCQACPQAPSPMGSLRSLYAYGGALAVTVHRFKYGKRLDLARPLAALLAPGLADPEALLVPIPSSQRALRHRGFDPLREILRTLDCFPRPDLCRSLNAQVMRSATLVAAPWPRYGHHHRWAPLLVRVDNGKPQASRPAHERRALSPEVFHLRRRPSPEDRPILLVDDVLATGATVRAAMAVFRAAGIRNVRAVTLLRSEVRTPT